MSEKFEYVVYKEKMVSTEQGSLEYKQFSSSWSLLQLQLIFAWVFLFFNDLFLLFILASVAANHKTANESDLLNNIARVLKYTHDKIVAGRGKIAMNETEYLNTCEYRPHYMKMVHTMAPRSNFALTFPINIQLS